MSMINCPGEGIYREELDFKFYGEQAILKAKSSALQDGPAAPAT
jgi:hypothetical protein